MKTKIILFGLAALFSYSASQVQWTDNETNLTTSDSVGIGIDIPEDKLHLNGNMSVPGVWTLSDNDSNRPLINTKWEAGIGDFISIKHGGANDELNTLGIRVSDGHGFECGKNNFNSTLFRITTAGDVGIGGTTNPDAKLTVAGDIHSREIRVTVNAGADFVFEEDYNLQPLKEVEHHIKTNKHLPEIPSEKQMLQDGVHLGEMNIKLLQKIEELTLYTIGQDKTLKEQQKLIKKLITGIETLENH